MPRPDMIDVLKSDDVTLEQIEEAMDWFDYCFENYRVQMSYMELHRLLLMKRAAREALSRQCFGKGL